MGISRRTVGARVAAQGFISFTREVVLCRGRHCRLLLLLHLHLQGFSFALCSSLCMWKGAAGVPRAVLH